jgi:hypothetical protein
VSTRAQGARTQEEGRPRLGAGDASFELEWICRSVLLSMSPSFRDARIVASFYPYIGLTHTIRRRDGDWVIRVSDHCRRAPGLVLEAIAIILGCKILRRRPPSRMLDVYDQFCRNPAVRAQVQGRRRLRGQKRINSVEGRHHDLAAIYRSLNEQYFGKRVEIGTVGWGLRASWRRLGHYDPLHQTITVSPVLDSPRVPQSVLAYLVYHEMLHAVFEDSVSPGRKRHHPPEFRRAERAYPTYDSARKFLDRFCKNKAQEPD